MSKKIKIQLNKPFFDKSDERAIVRALSKEEVSGDGFYSKKLQEELRLKLKVKYVLPTPSCTAALELAIMSLDLKKGDEVILPSFNFPSGATAILRGGAVPVFADIDRKTLCMESEFAGKMVTSKTRAIMVVHYAGHSCEMDSILRLARKHNCYVIEDAAHAIGAKYNNRPLGTIGDIGCFSFHGTKNIVTGEGGVFITNNDEIFRKAEIIREKGTNRAIFLRGEVDKYSWVSDGSSYLLADILSALAVSQIKKLRKITILRKRNAEYLLKKLFDLKNKVELPSVKSYTDSCWHIFAILVDKDNRSNFINFLKNKGIKSYSHYIPLHSSYMGKKLGCDKIILPNTDFISESIVRLPIHPSLAKKDLDYISDKIHEFFR